MSDPRLYSVENSTPFTATLKSTNNNGGDDCTIAPYQNFHTGGSGNDYIQIPQCSGAQYFNDHHIQITGADAQGVVKWKVALFSNDERNAVLYWNAAEQYDNSTELVGSAGDEVASALFIGQRDDGAVYVTWQGR